MPATAASSSSGKSIVVVLWAYAVDRQVVEGKRRLAGYPRLRRVLTEKLTDVPGKSIGCAWLRKKVHR